MKMLGGRQNEQWCSVLIMIRRMRNREGRFSHVELDPRSKCTVVHFACRGSASIYSGRSCRSLAEVWDKVFKLTLLAGRRLDNMCDVHVESDCLNCVVHASAGVLVHCLKRFRRLLASPTCMNISCCTRGRDANSVKTRQPCSRQEARQID